MDVVVSIEDVCGCCTPVAKKCFQSWTAVYDCDEETWTLTPGAKLCLPVGTSTDWTGSACSWQRYVPMDTDCTLNADCTGLDNTAEPPPPFAGEPPYCCNCLSVCGCRNVGRTAAISFAGVENNMPCTECVLGAGLSQFIRGGTMTLGTYTLTKGAGCTFQGTATFDFQTALGPTGGGCPPDGDFSTETRTATVTLAFAGGSWGLSALIEDIWIFDGGVDEGDCSGPLVIDNTFVAYDGCGLTTFAYMINGTATITFTPCNPV